MAFEQSGLQVVGYANGFTHWLYQTSDALKVVAAPNYFDRMFWAIRPRAGDQMTLHTSDGYAIAFMTRADEQAVALQVIGVAHPAAASDRAA